MLVTDLKIGTYLKNTGHLVVAQNDPHNSNYVLVRQALTMNEPNANSITHYRMHRNLWLFILENKGKCKTEFTTAEYFGISRVDGKPLLRYPQQNSTFRVILAPGDKPRLEYVKSLEDHKSIDSHMKFNTVYQTTQEIEVPEKTIDNKILLLV